MKRCRGDWTSWDVACALAGGRLVVVIMIMIMMLMIMMLVVVMMMMMMMIMVIMMVMMMMVAVVVATVTMVYCMVGHLLQAAPGERSDGEVERD